MSVVKVARLAVEDREGAEDEAAADDGQRDAKVEETMGLEPTRRQGATPPRTERAHGQKDEESDRK
jgi:hypothetical protein